MRDSMSAGEKALSMDARALVNLMRLQGELEIAVRLEAFAAQAPALFISVDDFGDARVLRQLRGQRLRQIHQQVGRRCRGGFQHEVNRRREIHGLCIETNFVRYEGSVIEGPQQLVQLFRLRQRVVEDDDPQIQQVRFLRQSAGERPALFCGGTFQDIEIDALGHVALARWIRKSTSNGTGRPVLPFCAPPSQAVPATSRWAHSRSLANFHRNDAAVQAPPSRPPTLAMSAKLLLSCSTYSSPIGSRQARSSARIPADSNSCARGSLLLIKPLV